ncbi:bifunctional hydroxymethylpyrimidine kinase/phosphomethylpyrimidine kinase [Rothia sp. P100]|uniref:bifunctional hydroxymethylpyrimidine kinase/phosphomethylpyrimidine kinase n=1 Tax=Rothia sp. P100 TaxID=2939578 RepID=UPI00203C709F|nr:bifunctional hydroxymethylpyrimidine kinase/phosphomethylpyrimidine kinase [Rothia sp. P100]MCM3510223.1 bifunctional hydroxymethylpyrimidine kinase/phosphomethylpyrimidine kinase [Rothia sp. P100]
MIARVLSIAGTDPTGGAGLQADVKSIAAAGGYGMGVVTSLVVQNTRGVQQVHTPDPDFLEAQLRAVSDDVTIDAVKVGMIADQASAAVVVNWLRNLPSNISVVVDPVMVASSGQALADSVSADLLTCATVLTPNVDELAALVGKPAASSRAELIAQAQVLAEKTGALVVAKGGHLADDDRGNTLVNATGELAHAASWFVDTTASHGTGCSLSSALATRLGLGESPQVALEWATSWAHEALQYGEAQAVGTGNGPIDHFHRLRRQAKSGLQNPTVPDKRNRHQPVVKASGEHTRELWEYAGESLDRFGSDGFISALMQGTLSGSQFTFYIEQDDYYLNIYAAVLARLAAAAQSAEERSFWAESVTGCIAVEQGMHAQWNLDPSTVHPSPATLAYTDFLRAETGSDYVVAVAAVLPCFWLYAQLAAFVPDAIPEDHPYKDWVEAYRDEAFQASTARAVQIAEGLLAAASDHQRAAAQQAFWRACQLEADFFAQALLLDTL